MVSFPRTAFQSLEPSAQAPATLRETPVPLVNTVPSPPECILFRRGLVLLMVSLFNGEINAVEQKQVRTQGSVMKANEQSVQRTFSRV